jgi:carbon-monoxide dehydrogenase medium subunit
VTLSVRDGAAERPRIALLGAGETPLRATAAEALLCGRALDAPLVVQAAAAVEADAQPNADLKASAALRRHLLGVLAKRAIVAAWRRAQAPTQDPRHARA